MNPLFGVKELWIEEQTCCGAERGCAHQLELGDRHEEMTGASDREELCGVYLEHKFARGLVQMSIVHDHYLCCQYESRGPDRRGACCKLHV